MKSPVIGTFSIILVSALVLHAASDKDSASGFRLSDYLPPPFKYHRFEITPDFYIGGQKADIETDRYDMQSQDQDNSNKITDAHYDLGCGLNDVHYGWKKKTEWETGGRANIRGYIVADPTQYRSEYNQNYSSRNDINGSGNLSYSISGSHYFSGPLFIGAGISPSINGYGGQKTFVEKGVYSMSPDTAEYTFSDGTENSRTTNINASANVRAGSGHINDVTFAAVALNMLDILAKNKAVSRSLRSADVQKLAQALELRRKRRVFDTRIAQIDDIDSLCMLLIQQGIAKSISPRTVMELADQWDYAFYQRRASGIQFVVFPEVNVSLYMRDINENALVCSLIVPGTFQLSEDDDLDFNNAALEESETNERYERKILFYCLAGKVRYEHPLTRYIQLSGSAKVSGGTYHRWHEERRTNSDKATWMLQNPALFTEANATAAYYPNTRTEFAVTPDAYYIREFDYARITASGAGIGLIPDVKKHDTRELYVRLSFSANYYLSPRMQILGRIYGGWYDKYSNSYISIPWDFNSREVYSRHDFTYGLLASFAWAIF